MVSILFHIDESGMRAGEGWREWRSLFSGSVALRWPSGPRQLDIWSIFK
jgi:hypothetical protein